jgi:hypothetical protein
MAVPPRSAKLPAVPRIDWADAEVAVQTSAAKTASADDTILLVLYFI